MLAIDIKLINFIELRGSDSRVKIKVSIVKRGETGERWWRTGLPKLRTSGT